MKARYNFVADGSIRNSNEKKISTELKLNIPKAEIGGAEKIVNGNALHEAEEAAEAATRRFC
jgi:hypothetical protein